MLVAMMGYLDILQRPRPFEVTNLIFNFENVRVFNVATLAYWYSDYAIEDLEHLGLELFGMNFVKWFDLDERWLDPSFWLIQ